MTTVSKLVASMSQPVNRVERTLPSPTSRGSSASSEHKALIAMELEVLAKKYDRFGWDRDRGSAVQDRLILDWIEALCGFDLAEIQLACRAAVRDCPDRMPNEGHVLQRILARRAEIRRAQPKPAVQDDRRPPTEAELAQRKKFAEEAMSGFRRMPGSAVGE